MRARGAMPEIVSTPRSRPKMLRIDAGVAACGRRGVRAVAVMVARRRVVALEMAAREFRPLENQRAPISLLLQSSARTARRLRTCRASDAGGGPYTRSRSVLPGSCPRSALVGEARVLGPDAGVDDADDDVLADRAVGATRPEAAVAGEPEVDRRVVGHRLAQLVLAHRHDVRLLREPCGLPWRELCGEPVEREGVVVELRVAGCARCSQGVGVTAVEEVLVPPDVRAVRVRVLALPRSCRREYPARPPS